MPVMGQLYLFVYTRNMKPGEYKNISKQVTSTTEFVEIELFFCYFWTVMPQRHIMYIAFKDLIETF